MAAYRSERVIHHPALTLKYIEPARRSGLRIVVGTKVSKKATERNQLKRRLREIWRSLPIVPNVAATFYTKSTVLPLSFAELKAVVTRLAAPLIKK
ncbi:MAG: ribonuclease P protein component [Patescibacteria group bacterium]|jgi:ribonuclease P protein component